MERYDKETYGAAWAGGYDQIFSEVAPGMIDRLAELADGGRILELAIGTGRIALPLTERGLDVSGIDISPDMVAQLRGKAGGDAIQVTIGDFADVSVDGKFALIYVIFNTLFALLDQADQVRCFVNVASHLEAGGRFVIEAFVPDLDRFDRGQRVQVDRIDLERVLLEVGQHDLASQRLSFQYVTLAESGVNFLPVSIRYAWPSELDLMAQLAGLELEHRWGGWEMEPFTSDSPRHVSVYKVPAA